jgi:Fic family protein
MFTPKYTISQKLLENIKRITALISELNHHRFPKTVLVDFEKAAREISSHSSTSIEGNPLPLTEVKKILQHKPENIRDSEKEVLNYNEILDELNEKVTRGKINLDLDLILHIQKKVTLGLIEKYRSGFLRTEPVFVNNPQTGNAVYLPPDQRDVPCLIDDLLKWSHENNMRIDPLLIAGIFHKQFVIIHPFIDGNGRTARLATKMLLAKMGLNTFNLFSFENYYNKNVSAYFQKVGEFGNYYDIFEKVNFTAWMEYFTDGIIDELLRVQHELEQKVIVPELILSPHLTKILNFVKKNGLIRDRDYAKFTARSKSARNLDFNKLLQLGLLIRHGQGKATYYKLK